MAARRASEGLRELASRTSGPNVKATVTVNQPYAQDQHETLFYKHPRGGQAKYLETPLFTLSAKWIQEFANRLLAPGRDAAHGWGGVGRSLVKAMPKFTPVEFGDLKQSAALEVREGGSLIIDEPPIQPRLTDSELDAKDHMRHGGLGYRS